MSRIGDARGFTLLEALLALAIVALLGVGAYGLLAATARFEDGALARQRSVAALQRTVRLLEEDLAALPARWQLRADPFAEPVLDGAPPRGAVALTRVGVSNSLGRARSRLQRVLWELEDGGVLTRHAAFGAAGAQGAVRRMLAEGVGEFALRYLDEHGVWHATWPPPATGGERPGMPGYERVPVAVEFRLLHAGIGEVVRVVALR